MAFIGGIFAIYALLEHSNVFGSAETSNMILLVHDILHWSLFSVLIRTGSLIVYAAGITTALWVAKYHSQIQKIVCIVIDALAAAVLIVIPAETPPVIAIYPVAFAMSIQWCSFRGVGKNPSATTFSTGNFCQLITNIFNFFTEKKSEYLANIKFYILTILLFHLGVAVIYILQPYIPHHSISFVYIPLFCAAIQEYKMIFGKNKFIMNIIPQNAGCDDV